MPQKQVAILVVIMYVALSACVESQPTSAPLSQLAVYEWIGTSPPPHYYAWLRTNRPAFKRPNGLTHKRTPVW